MDTLTEILGLSVHDMGSDMEGYTIEQHRAEFEEWVVKRTVVTKYGAKLKQTSNGNYADYRINDRWLTWKAARGIKE